ncbi:MAG TPA: hypothetical protein VMW29_03485 [Candidatus Bathyarchaeia archaeon]|nr:hypothetical protein [Candidatus Bathyarchaeia archaeon]
MSDEKVPVPGQAAGQGEAVPAPLRSEELLPVDEMSPCPRSFKREV